MVGLYFVIISLLSVGYTILQTCSDVETKSSLPKIWALSLLCSLGKNKHAPTHIIA